MTTSGNAKSVPSRRAHVSRVLLTLAVTLAWGAILYAGIGSPSASQAAGFPRPLHEAPPEIEQLVPVRAANGDLDVGPGQMEPMLVGAPADR